MKKQINVVGAVIVKDWEFPGGKIEEGETPRDALVREITEELECQVEVGDKVETTKHEYDFGVVTLTTFFCTLMNGGTPNLTEHVSVQWLPPQELGTLDWAPADIPAIEVIKNRLAL